MFGKRKRELPPLISDEEIDRMTDVNYNTVLEWLVGLSDQDFDKVCKISTIYRQADKDAAQELEMPNEPVTFIHPPEPVSDEPNLLDDLLMDDEPSEKPKKTNKVKPNASH